MPEKGYDEFNELAEENARLLAAIEPLIPIADAILSEAPADAGYYSMFKTCDGQSLRITMDELRAVAALKTR